MNKQIEAGAPVSGRSFSGVVSETIFLTVIIAITLGGVWSLYMTDAPYHPEISRLDSGIMFASN